MLNVNIDALRAEIERANREVKDLMGFDLPEHSDIGEVKANIMLSYRHLEDARMRLGKVLQALEGGKSIYDK